MADCAIPTTTWNSVVEKELPCVMIFHINENVGDLDWLAQALRQEPPLGK